MALSLAAEATNWQPRNIQTMDWIPVVLVTFKAVVFGTGMFFAIKWHYDREKEEKAKKLKKLKEAEKHQSQQP